MDIVLNQILSILTVPPGNLVYHLVLAFSITGALQGAIQHWRVTGFPQARRALIGLIILLIFQVILFVVSGLGWQGLLESKAILPPLDRAIALLSLIWIIWLWVFPEPTREADAASILLSLLVVTLLGANYTFGILGEGIFFNQSGFEILWQGLGSAIALLGLIGVLLRRPNGWGNALGMILLFFIGHVVSLLWRQESDYAGLLRLAHLAVFPLLLTLPQRFPVQSERRVKVVTAAAEGGEQQAVRQERRRYSTDPKTFQSMVSLAGETLPDKIAQALTRSVSQAMLADLCFLFVVDERKELSIACGYDLIREESLSGAPADKNAFPILANAIIRGRPLRLPASSTSTDLQGLGQLLGLSNAGHLLCVPIISPVRGPIASILLLSPYSNRQWSAEDQAYLSNVAPLFLPVLERAERIASLEVAVEQARQQAQNAQSELAEARQRLQELQAELDNWREKVNQMEQQQTNVTALLVMQEEMQKLIEQLQAENAQLKSAGLVIPGGTEQLERELRQSLEELARMQNALAEANVKILELERRPRTGLGQEQVEIIASIAQELRQPMSSIVGYTDLLLGESVGLLGALQRKFVERIKVATERMTRLLEDLVHITNLETGHMRFQPDNVDVNLIVDSAMAHTSAEIREKNITLHLDIPEKFPRVKTDAEALQQILIHLMQNAVMATPPEGKVSLRLKLQEEDNQKFLAIQVSDSGGGIPAEELGRVFLHRYRAEHPLIPGLGDTSVGLAIAKALTDAQKGRIWVETEAGVGSTFSVLLPIGLGDEASGGRL
ncbi:MAG: ATP-binding protein [Anaerolineales bacterium]|nr:ATP-binding protein [Anaerolineales bacterium]MCX7607672.1 ATP-binding protein [Anaerolineales bacterium]MDW8226981.1 ATP-binding protein [Anaerolineales bacterium]